jgi:hypothetical protein
MSKSLPVQAQLLAFFAGLFLAAVATQGQAAKGDFSSVAAAGKVNGDTY